MMKIEELTEAMGIATRPVFVYDAPEQDGIASVPLKRCIFQHYQDWQEGRHVAVADESKCCPGCGYWLRGLQTFPSREAFVNFLAVKEGLRASRELMNEWLDGCPPYSPEHSHLYIGPEIEGLAEYLKSVTFFVVPDQLSLLCIGATYHSHPTDPSPVVAPFGSGCGQMLPLFPDLNRAQAVIGATDIAMRSYIPDDILAFTVTRLMLERLLSLDAEDSFLGKHFYKKLREARQG